ncbi:MAG TPA: hypothetical protein PK664_06540 [Paludibacteraceae bacterium]|mgnify:CR=1 FL=1|nr:hypothetical protein [Bacteroidales bacterium]HPS11013.1 hypothetical protein [Paludibacteraceae bacterium]
MKSFINFNMETMGGCESFLFAPKEDILLIPAVVNNVIAQEIQFYGSNTFYFGAAIMDTLSFSEEQQDGDPGASFKTEITGMVPRLTAEYLDLFNEMRRHRFVVLVKDNNGLSRLVGTKSTGMKFWFKQSTKTTPSGLNGFEFGFSLSSEKPAPFYTYTEPVS